MVLQMLTMLSKDADNLAVMSAENLITPLRECKERYLAFPSVSFKSDSILYCHYSNPSSQNPLVDSREIELARKCPCCYLLSLLLPSPSPPHPPLQMLKTVKELTELCESREASRSSLHQNILGIIFSGTLQTILNAIEDSRREREMIHVPKFSAIIKYLSSGSGM